MTTIRLRTASSSPSKRSSSTPTAPRKNRVKLTPPATKVAPSGKLRPTISAVRIRESSVSCRLSCSRTPMLNPEVRIRSQCNHSQNQTQIKFAGEPPLVVDGRLISENFACARIQQVTSDVVQPDARSQIGQHSGRFHRLPSMSLQLARR